MSLTHGLHPPLTVLPSLRASHKGLPTTPQHHRSFALQPHVYLQQRPPQLSVPSPLVPATGDLSLVGPLRRGKWTRAEEDYASATISYFCDGVLTIQYGTTLRGYLAHQLHCDPMRISKKLLPGSVFAGIKINPKIGRRAYYPCAPDSPAAAHSKETAAYHLTSLRVAFLQSIQEEDPALEARGFKDSTPRTFTPRRLQPLNASSARKRSYDDINSVLCAQPQQYVRDEAVSRFQPARHLAAGNGTTASKSTISAVLCKLPKLRGADDVASRAAYATPQRSVSPVTVAASTAVLPPLRVSLVRAAMC